MVKHVCATKVADNVLYTHEDVIVIQYDFFVTNVNVLYKQITALFQY